MEKLNRFFKTAGVYFCGIILSRLITILLLPIYTSHINPEQYGEYRVVVAIVNLLYLSSLLVKSNE